MATLTAADEVLLQDALLQKRIANLAKIGLSWTPPSQRPVVPKVEEPVPASLPSSDSWISTTSDGWASTTSTAPKGPKHPRKEKDAGSDSPPEPESESEMMGSAYQDSVARTKQKRDAHVIRSDGISRAEAHKLDKAAFADLGLMMGEKSAKVEQFIPWRFLVRYGELYVGKKNTPKVEPYFETDKLFEMQPWDFFYLYDPETLADNTDAVLFVRTVQFEALLRKINRKQGIALTIPDGGNEVKFQRQFPECAPQPRFLCRTTAASSYHQMLRCCPLPEAEDDLSKIAELDREAFNLVLRRCKESWDSTHTKDKRSKSRKKGFARYESRKAWGHASKRVQRWLGLRGKATSEVSHAVFIGQEAPAAKPVLDLNAPAPYDNGEDVVLISFDVETDENSGSVTEIGFGSLDTHDLKGVAPGEGGENWFKLIQARHLRIKEYLHIKNHKYVEGCPHHFQFGESEIVGLDRIERVCTEILSPKDANGRPRKVVIVGHDIKQDIELVFGLDIDIYELPGLFDIIDNQRIHQHDVKFKDPQRLAVVLQSLNIEHHYLHNGGNDAVYTLQSTLAIAVRRRQNSLAEGPKLKVAPRPKPELGEVVLDEGWSTGGEDSDGGQPPRLVDPHEDLKDPITGTKGISSLTINDEQ